MEKRWVRLRALAGRAFSPGAPVDEFKLFCGRTEQIKSLIKAVTSRGCHMVMYGQRGVGKTSLASMFKHIFEDFESMRFIKINCTKDDDFGDVWRRSFESIPVLVEGGTPETRVPGRSTIEYNLSQFLPDEVGAGDIRRIIEQECDEGFEIVLVFDEFNVLDEDERAVFADTIKDLSDNSVAITLVLVGVANNILELLKEHESIERCLVQIAMPPMTQDELTEIVDRAMTVMQMEIDEDARDLIVFLSRGFPHYTHLLGQESAFCAIDRESRQISLQDVKGGIDGALKNTLVTTREAYHRATQAQRKGTLYGSVLLACAMAHTDDRGFFSSTDVREPLRRITQTKYEIPAFSRHLKDFSEDEERGPVFECTGKKRRARYAFNNPLLRPYVILRGIREGVVVGDLLEEMGMSREAAREFQGLLPFPD